jgi:hypothetical protein
LNPDKVKASRRAYLLKQTPGYIAGYQRANSDPVRIAKKNAQARARYWSTRTVPTPTCRICGIAIARTKGRPPVTCGTRGVCLAQVQPQERAA